MILEFLALILMAIITGWVGSIVLIDAIDITAFVLVVVLQRLKLVPCVSSSPSNEFVDAIN